MDFRQDLCIYHAVDPVLLRRVAKLYCGSDVFKTQEKAIMEGKAHKVKTKVNKMYY